MISRKLIVLLAVGAATGALAFGALVFVRLAVFHTWRIPAGSMYPALQRGDLVLGNQWRPQERIERGTLVIFRVPRDPNTQHVKRIIGLPGEEIAIDSAGVVSIDGTALPRCELGPWPDDAEHEVTGARASLEQFGTRSWVVLSGHGPMHGPARAQVPEGQVFVLGDDRDNSWDSRFFGTVRMEDVDAIPARLLRRAGSEAIWQGTRPSGVDVPHLPPALVEAASRCRSE